MTDTSSAIQSDGKCNWCGNYHGVKCPEVKALEFHPDGTIKRVEFTTAADYPQPDWKIDVGNIGVGYTRSGYAIPPPPDDWDNRKSA